VEKERAQEQSKTISVQKYNCNCWFEHLKSGGRGKIVRKITAIVFKKDGKPKEGRGFSIEELKKVKLDFKKALRFGIAVDLKRRTLHKENVEALKEYVKNAEKAKK